MHDYADQLVTHLLSGDQDRAWDIIMKASLNGENSLFIYQDIVTEAMREIGALWEKNEISVADEHLATTTCDFLLSRYHFYKKPSYKHTLSPKKAMFLCLEQEQHFLGLKMASLLFEEHGWKTRLLGANLPLEYAQKVADEWEADVACLSVTIAYHTSRLTNYIQSLEKGKSKPVVLLGGRLLSKYDFSPHTSLDTHQFIDFNQLEKWLLSGEREVKENARH